MCGGIKKINLTFIFPQIKFPSIATSTTDVNCGVGKSLISE
jgi:hypothetical protein